MHDAFVVAFDIFIKQHLHHLEVVVGGSGVWLFNVDHQGFVANQVVLADFESGE